MARHQLTTLPGGERVVTERIDGVRSVALGLWIGAGSRDEPDEAPASRTSSSICSSRGLSATTPVQIAELFDAMGGELNAATSRETTVVYTRVPDDHLDVALDVMTDMVFAPSLADIDSEREVVLEEIAMVDDNPQDLVHDLAAEAVFGAHPLGRPVIGEARGDRVDLAAVAARLPPRRVRRPERRPRRRGQRRHKRLRRAGGRPAAERPSPLTRPPATAARRPRPGIRFLRRPTEQYHVCLAGPGIRRRRPPPLRGPLLDAILGGSASSRLFQEIREKRGMAYSVYSVRRRSTTRPGRSASTSARARRTCGKCLEVIAPSSRTSAPATSAPASSSARRRT